MAIWSLTQERIDKLRKQVGDKEEEITKLTKTSDKDLWRADLDDFIGEWRTVLDEEAKHNKEMSRMGRRESKKLKIGANKGKKRKQADSEDDFASESDYAAPAKKAKASGKPTAAEIFDFGPAPIKKEEKKKPISKAKAGLLSAVDQKPTSKPPAVTAGLIDDKSVSIISDDEIDVRPSLVKAPAAAPAPKPRKKKAIHDSSDEDDEGQALRDYQMKSKAEQRERDRKYEEEERANEAKARAKKAAQSAPRPSTELTSAAPAAGPTAGRAARGAATKTVNYNVDSDDSMDEVMDLGSKLKTYNASATAGSSKPLFRESASASRPSSSHSVTKQKTSRPRDDYDDVDGTDYASLMPRGSPTKAAAKSARDATGFGDEDDSLLDIAVDQQKASVGLKVIRKNL